jgi:hypothetical protein
MAPRLPTGKSAIQQTRKSALRNLETPALPGASTRLVLARHGYFREGQVAQFVG